MSTNYHPRESPGLCTRYHKAVELIGRRWTGAVISLLLDGPKRFSQLLDAIPGISDRLLCERLRELERLHIVRRAVARGRPVRVTYQLTRAGAQLQPAVQALGRWAHRWLPAPAGFARAPR